MAYYYPSNSRDVPMNAVAYYAYGGQYSGIGTQNLNGCTAVAIVGPHGATVGHASPGQAQNGVQSVSAAQQMSYITQQSINNYQNSAPSSSGRPQAYIFPAQNNGEVMLQEEIEAAQQAYAAQGWNTQVQPYSVGGQQHNRWVHVAADTTPTQHNTNYANTTYYDQIAPQVQFSNGQYSYHPGYFVPQQRGPGQRPH